MVDFSQNFVSDLPTVADCRECQLPTFSEGRGNLTALEAGIHCPFPIRRLFYLHGVPAGKHRAGHSLRSCNQMIVMLTGSMAVRLYDGNEWRNVVLDSPERGLLLPPMVWRELSDFSENAICLVVADEHYDEAAYVRNLSEFTVLRANG